MKVYRFLSVIFLLVICYQLCNIDSTHADNNFNVFKKDSVIISNIENNIDHLIKPTKYSLSKQGKDFIKKYETCILHAYNDPDELRRSIGWGHQIRPGENLEYITQSKADELFEKDIEWVNNAINRLIKQNDSRFIYSQGFIDGLGSLIYNCGEYGVTQTTFYKRWKRCRYDINEPGFINYNDLIYTIAGVKTSRISSPGHIQRRYEEHKLMLN